MSDKPAAGGLPNYFELFQNLAGPFAANPAAALFPTLDPKEIERKRKELQTVLLCLKAQVGMVELSIQTLEYQQNLLAQATAKTTAQAAPSPLGQSIPDADTIAKMAAMNPALWAWNLMQQPAASPEKPTKKTRAAPKKRA
ncbi:MAG: hypothetical protein JNM52_10835 [Betaproteobacteria bacterium]|nr:hypothetical protein [Betaproteobacteria bacterium]